MATNDDIDLNDTTGLEEDLNIDDVRDDTTGLDDDNRMDADRDSAL